MAAQALYLKYRPRTFDEVAGQEPITRTLRNALVQGRFRHAYLFTGPRGTGKTTTARLLAKAISCLAPEDQRPCNACSICTAVNEGRLLDLIEIDAASNRGIDEIRDIREKVGFRPAQASHKVYVLDEAHMLTGDAFNALLKTLEEPPPHVVFVLVTTEPHKIPATIASRCQRFDFRRVPLQAIVDRLEHIARTEGLVAEPAALDLIARHSTGALRDAISLLDQLTNYGEEIRLEQVQQLLGTVAGMAAGSLVTCVADGDLGAGLDLINRAIGDGADPRQLGREVIETLRGILLVQQGAGARLLSATLEQAAEMEVLAHRMPAQQVLRAIHLFNEATTSLRRGLETLPQLALEMALVESVLGQPEPVPESPPGYEPLRVREAPSPPRPAPPAAPAAQPAASSAGAAPEDRPSPAAPAPAGRPAAPEEGRPLSPPVQPEIPSLTLDQVTRAWKGMVHAMRQRNPTTQAALASGCQPVEVKGNEVIVTLPFSMLEKKLRDPQRALEIDEVLSEVLGTRCHVRLVLASEYAPPREPPQEDDLPAPDPVEAEAAPDAEAESITQWALERGGQVTYLK